MGWLAWQCRWRVESSASLQELTKICQEVGNTIEIAAVAGDLTISIFIARSRLFGRTDWRPTRVFTKSLPTPMPGFVKIGGPTSALMMRLQLIVSPNPPRLTNPIATPSGPTKIGKYL